MDRTELIASRSFLGCEFLVWLWFCEQAEADGGKSAHHAVGSDDVEVRLVDCVVLDGMVGDADRIACTGSAVSTAQEARMALALGKQPSAATFTIRRGERTWTVKLAARTLRLSVLRLPGLLTRVEDDRFYERMQHLSDVAELVDCLYRDFVLLRVSPGWAESAEQIRAWGAGDVAA